MAAGARASGGFRAYAGPVPEPPPLPRRFSDIYTVVGVGSALWLLGAVAFLVSGRPLGIWFTTCLTGLLLGGVGIGIYSWQRAAARRGSRTAQQGLINARDSAGDGARDGDPRDDERRGRP
jgi:Protein of unknown function (DUF2530)